MALNESARRRIFAVLGTILGVTLLAVAISGISAEEFKQTLDASRPGYLIAGGVAYWLAMLLRVARWRLLLTQLQPVSPGIVAETLVVGYAMNNLLPARLGEFFRADYAKRRMGISRTTILGSIAIERALDLLAVLALLLAGLWIYSLSFPENIQQFGRFVMIVALVIGGIFAVLGYLWLRGHTLGAGGGLARRLAADLVLGIRSLNHYSVVPVVVLSLGIWLLEVIALAFILQATSSPLALGHVCFLLGVATLSTLVPTAPAYLGSYQLVFSFLLERFGQSAAAGVIAATAVQLFFYGSVAIIGLALLARRWLRGDHKESRSEAAS